MPKKKYYVVWQGRHTGIFDSWDECAAQVSGYPEAEYKAFPTRQAAQEAFKRHYADYKGKHISSLSQARLIQIGAPILPSCSVDAACSDNPGRLEYRCVDTETGKEILRRGPFEHGTNNIGEFLAIVHALALLKNKHRALPIYSDSKNAIAWVKARRCRTRLERDERNAELFDLIEWAEAWLADNSYTNKILKWETEAWGEIPADFGRK